MKGKELTVKEIKDHLTRKGMDPHQADSLIRERLQLRSKLLRPELLHIESPESQRLQEINQIIFGA